MDYRKLSVLVCVCFFPLIAARSWADDSSLKAAQTQLTTQADEFRKERNKIPAKKEEKPEIVVEKEVAPPPVEAGPSFTVRQFTFEGNTLFTPNEFKVYTDKFINRPISFKDMNDLTQLITNHYRTRGYLTSRAYVPAQKMKDGVVLIKILEGKVGKIKVEGNRYFRSSSYTEAIKLRPDRILDYAELEKSLYLINLKPDRRVRGYLGPGEVPETSDITLKTEETNPFHLYYDFNNRGTKLTHRARNGILFNDNNISGREDILNGSFTLAEQGALAGSSLEYTLPLGNSGTALHFDTSYVQSMLEKEYRTSEVKGRFSSFTPGISHDFIETPEMTLMGYLGLEIKDSKSTINDDKTSFDRMRVLKAGPEFSFTDTFGRTSLACDIHWGIPDFLCGLGQNDPNASRPNSGGDFIYYTASIARQQRMSQFMMLILRMDGQWTDDTLTSLEEYRAGGATSVRGYPEADALGDYGYTFSGELRASATFIPKEWLVPFTRIAWQDALQMVGFLDGSKLYLRERPTPTTVKDTFLLGAGYGLRFSLDRNLFLQVDVGYPIGDTPSDRSKRQVHLSLMAGF